MFHVLNGVYGLFREKVSVFDVRHVKNSVEPGGNVSPVGVVMKVNSLISASVGFQTVVFIVFFMPQGHNGNHERIDFLTSKEKVPSKRKVGLLIGVLVAVLILLAVAAFLIWLFVCE